MSNVKDIFAVVLSGISFVFAVVGVAMPFWYYYSVGEFWASGGLWQKCNNVSGSTKYVGAVESIQGVELEDFERFLTSTTKKLKA